MAGFSQDNKRKKTAAEATPRGLWGGYNGELDGAGFAGSMIDALCGLLVVGGFGPEDVGDEGLGVAVVEGKPT